MTEASSPMTRATAAATRPDSPGVRVPPPVHFALAVVAGLLLQRVLPLPVLPHAVALWSGVALMAGRSSVERRTA